eukprot:scaffold1130_cov195-Pinguiococcus_pyrenoidosus.AAC.25
MSERPTKQQTLTGCSAWDLCVPESSAGQSNLHRPGYVWRLGSWALPTPRPGRFGQDDPAPHSTS